MMMVSFVSVASQCVEVWCSMLAVMLTTYRRVEGGASQAKTSRGVVGGGGGETDFGFADGDGEVGAGGEEEREGVVGTSMVGIWC